jgi:hypothetical protein
MLIRNSIERPLWIESGSRVPAVIYKHAGTLPATGPKRCGVRLSFSRLGFRRHAVDVVVSVKRKYFNRLRSNCRRWQTAL